jgi:hypothetical protein
MGACYNTILLPSLSREALLQAIGEYLADHGAVVEAVARQERPEEAFAAGSAKTVLYGPPSEAGWVPISSWGDSLLGIGYPVWYTANPLARALSRHRSPAIYLFSFDAGLVAGYSVFINGDLVEGQTVPWKEGALVGPEFAMGAPPPRENSHLGAALGEADFDYVKFARSFRSVERATGELVARFGLVAHLMDPLHMTEGHGLALIDGQYRRAPLDGWSCVIYRRRGGPA